MDSVTVVVCFFLRHSQKEEEEKGQNAIQLSSKKKKVRWCIGSVEEKEHISTIRYLLRSDLPEVTLKSAFLIRLRFSIKCIGVKYWFWLHFF